MSSLKSPNILCMEELSLFQLNHDWFMDTNEGLCPHGVCMNPLTMANKGMTMYFFVRELALVLELPRRNF